MALRMLRTLTRRSGILDLAGRTILVRTADVAVSLERVAGGDLSALDDVTLSLRRLISAMAAYQRVFPSRVWKRLMDDATSLVRPTAELREIETRRQWILGLREKAPEQALPGIEALLTELEIRERELTSFFERALHRFRAAETLERMSQIVSATTGVPKEVAEAELRIDAESEPDADADADRTTGGGPDMGIRAAAEELVDALGPDAGIDVTDAVAADVEADPALERRLSTASGDPLGTGSEQDGDGPSEVPAESGGRSLLSVPGEAGFAVLEQAAQVVSWQIRFFESALSAFLDEGEGTAQGDVADESAPDGARAEDAAGEGAGGGTGDAGEQDGGDDGGGRRLQIPDLGSLVRRLQDAVDLFSPVFGARLRRAAEEVGGLGRILDELNASEGLEEWLSGQLEGMGARDPRAAGICYVLADVRARRDAAMRRIASEWTPGRVQRIREVLTDAAT